MVTGGAGYIGTHTAVELIAAGYDVVVVDNLSNSERAAVDGVREITGAEIPFEQVDCDDKAALAGVFDKYKFNSVIHFAASKAVGESVEKPLLYYRNNILSLVNVLELMREKGVRNIVFSSSCTVYGQPEVLPVTEQTPRQPATSPYGNTKQICEDILRDTTAAYGELYGIALRYFNPIGAHPSALIGELPKGIPGNLVPFITQTAAGIRPCLSIFGDDYDTSDGSAVRDYIDVVDLARAHVVAVDRMVGGKSRSNYEFFNVGTGQGRSVIELVETFEKVTETIPETVAVKGDFTITTAEHDVETYKMGADSIEDNVKVLEEYGAMLDALKARGADESTLSSILNMDIEEGMEFGSKLLNMSDQAWNSYFDSLERLHKTAAEISAKYYQNEVNSLKENFVDKLRSAFDGMTSDMYQVGFDTAKAFVEGWNKQLGTEDLTLGDIAAAVSGGTLSTAPVAAQSMSAAGTVLSGATKLMSQIVNVPVYIGTQKLADVMVDVTNGKIIQTGKNVLMT